jgi:hypothetical protein
MLDFKLKTRPCNTAPIDSSKNATFLAINHRSISFEAETYKGNKKVPHRFTIIRPLQSGWAGAPYKKNQKGVVTKRLSEMSTTGDTGPVIKMFSFDKGATNMEKGQRRDEYFFELRSGVVLNFWLDEQRLAQMKKDQPTLPESIPMFTICEIQVAPKNVDGVAKQSACKVIDVKPKSFTLHSCMEVIVSIHSNSNTITLTLASQDIERMPSSLVDARTFLLKYQQTQPHIANDIVTEEPAFHIYAQHKAYIHDELEGQIPGQEMITLVNSGTEPIDIPVSTLLHYTNSTRKDWACSLLELAIANNALQLLVFSNDYWKSATHSSLRGIPIVNTETLLQSVVPALVGTQSSFPTPNTTTIEDTTYSIHIQVDPEPTAVATGAPPSAPDFILACKDVELERAYRLTFSLCNHDGNEIPRYWVGYFDASPRRSGPVVGYKKRKITPCDEDE